MIDFTTSPEGLRDSFILLEFWTHTYTGSSNPKKDSQITNSKDNTSRGNVKETQASKKSWEGGDIENCNFKIVSQNVKGLKTNKIKRETIFNYLKENGDIALLQETHSTPETEDLWKNECGCESFFSHGTNNLCGVMIFF